MKQTFQFLALVAICSAMMVSCKNTKTTEPTPEEIQAQKVALADSVLAQIDAINEDFQKASEESFLLRNFILTEEEKMVKPDYLLDPSFASTLVTKSQKVNALGIYLADMMVRIIYDLPKEEAKEVIAQLAIELNHPIEADFITDSKIPASEKIKREYEECRKCGDLVYFWQLQHAVNTEIAYILAQNPELFFSKITEEQWKAFVKRTTAKTKALRELAKYDEEMAAVFEVFNQTRSFSSDEEYERTNSSIESAKQFRIANKDKYIARRNALLQ